MRISVLTLFPKMISPFLSESIVKKAIEKKLVEVEIINLRDFAIDKRGTVDDRPYGGGAGMVLRVEPIYKAISRFNLEAKKNSRSKILLTSPKGEVFNQKKAEEYAKLDNLMIIAGHYEGVDERVLDFVDEEVSVGDFILTGGEIPAVLIVDSVLRLIPGVLKKKEAVKIESFFQVEVNQLIDIFPKNKKLISLVKKGVKKVKLLEYPQYTRPDDFMGKKVPKVLLSGDHREIERWRLKKALQETLKKRPDLLK